MAALLALAGVALAAGAALERQLVGVGLYAIGMVAAFAIPRVTDVPVFDERNDAIHRRASGATLALFGWLSALVFPSLVVLSGTDHFSWGPSTVALAWTTLAVYATYAHALGYYAR